MPTTRSDKLAPKETRINVRVNAAQKAVIARAARMDLTTLTDYVVRHALEAANQRVADETRLLMTAKQFQKFCDVLDRPPAKNLKAMQRLLSGSSLLDE